jgi:hypothetical protein
MGYDMKFIRYTIAVMLAICLGLLVTIVSAQTVEMTLSQAFQVFASVSDTSVAMAAIPETTVQVPQYVESARELIDAFAKVYGLAVCDVNGVLVVSGLKDACEGVTDVAGNASANTRHNEVALGSVPSGTDVADVGIVGDDDADVVPVERTSDTARADSAYIVRLRILDVSEEKAQSAGVDLNNVSLPFAELLAGNFLAAGATFASDALDDALVFLASEGVATKLDDISVYVRGDSPALFQSGGSVNVQLVGSGEGVVTKSFPYGLTFEVSAEPVAEVVNLAIRVDASVPINASDAQLINLSSRNLQAYPSMRCGESAVIGSLFQSRDDLSGSGLPGMAEVPIIGYSFGLGRSNFSRSTLLLTVDLVCQDS